MIQLFPFYRIISGSIYLREQSGEQIHSVWQDTIRKRNSKFQKTIQKHYVRIDHT